MRRDVVRTLRWRVCCGAQRKALPPSLTGPNLPDTDVNPHVPVVLPMGRKDGRHVRLVRRGDLAGISSLVRVDATNVVQDLAQAGNAERFGFSFPAVLSADLPDAQDHDSNKDDCK